MDFLPKVAKRIIQTVKKKIQQIQKSTLKFEIWFVFFQKIFCNTNLKIF